jgi:uncharacterized protein (TIGR00661 family)
MSGMENKPKPVVIVCPLNWGIGHATRCVPIVHQLLAHGYQPVLASSGQALEFLKRTFPELPHEELPDYQIRYQKKGSFSLKIVKLIPSILKAIKKERQATEELVKKYAAVGIISDNRFGCRSKKVPSVFITHQIRVLSPVGQRLLRALNKKHINKFDACWIPDFEGDKSLTGKLSKPYKSIKRVEYLGALSRLQPQSPNPDEGFQYLALLSGPEPQRSILEDILKEELKAYSGKSMLIRGVFDGECKTTIDGQLTIKDHALDGELERLISDCKVVISRSGYSTVMDLCQWGKRAIMVPTPGQTEQEFLSERLDKKGYVPNMAQTTFNLAEAERKLALYTGLPKMEPSSVDWAKLFKPFEG